ncbi:MAG: hypothetical protein A3E78_09390 [Alphaproteobacteria bacterium RIFCSPHIGHO2_12_FULL_63_12]|nr:MAG: hypothetical protein A3E78_09390 [Alphaproteobacteria bacterium RIFCSPHIGHO2_12_FULL_63_12]
MAARTGRPNAVLGPAFALQFLANQLAGAADGFRLLPGLLFRGFFVKLAPLHFAERAFALHLLLERAERLLDIIVADYNLNQGNTLLLMPKRRPEPGPAGWTRRCRDCRPGPFFRPRRARLYQKGLNLSILPVKQFQGWPLS